VVPDTSRTLPIVGEWPLISELKGHTEITNMDFTLYPELSFGSFDVAWVRNRQMNRARIRGEILR
jgi:hypothetical protein